MSGATPAPWVLEIDNVTKSYGRGDQRVVVLRDVTLAVAAGQTVWVRGESGSGKSSLLRVAGLLSTPDSGAIRLSGAPVSASSRSHDVRRRAIGMVFQSANLLPDLTVADNLAVARSGLTPTQARSLLDGWGLGDLADRPAKQISGGQAQRVALCRALVNDPVVLLADEPTSGLDGTNTALVLEALATASARGRAVVVASHDPVFGEVADLVVEMSGGRVV